MKRLLLIGTVFLLALPCVAQSKTPAVVRTPEGDIPIPVATGVLGQVDPAASDEIARHVAAVGSTAWVGMQGKGTIIYGSKDATPYDATLSNLGGDEFRLDAGNAKGTVSVRIHRDVGQMVGVNGATISLPLSYAKAGILPFEKPRTPRITPTDYSLRDDGALVLDGTELHRITLEELIPGIAPLGKAKNTVATDLYFDPKTDLLVKSCVWIPITGTRNASFLFVVTYSDYRNVGGSMVPFRFTETMQGELSRTLQLSAIDLNPTFDSTYFKF